ncbi:MAG: MFS transporter [Myxococcota bacterium]
MNDENADADRRSSRLGADSLFTDAVLGLVSGALLIDYLTTVDQPTWLAGVVLALPYLSQLLQIPLLNASRRVPLGPGALAVAGQLLARGALVPMIALPWVPSPTVATLLIAGAFVVYALGDALFNAVWNPILKAAVPEETSDRFWARKLQLGRIAMLSVTLAGGQFIDGWQRWVAEKENITLAYPIMWVAIIGWSFVGTWRLARTKVSVPRPEPIRWRDLAAPRRDANFNRWLRYLFAWNLTVFVSTSYFSAYMIKMLDYSVGLATIMMTMSQVVTTFTFSAMGRFAGVGNRRLLLFSAPVYLVSILIWTMTTLPGRHQLSMPLVVANFVVFGIATAATQLANQRLSFSLTPQAQAPTYLAVSSMAAALGAGLGSLVGGIALSLFDANDISFNLGSRLYLNTWDSLFVVAAALGVVGLSFIRGIEEPAPTSRAPTAMPAPAPMAMSPRYGRDFN